MKKLLLTAIGLFGLYGLFAQSNPFITQWNVANDLDTIQIGLNAGQSYDFSYVWKNNADSTVSSGTHASADGAFKTGFAKAGTYTLEITGSFPHFTNYPKGRLLDVQQWGDIVWKSFNQTFANWSGTTFSATDAPILSEEGVSFFRIFRQSGSFAGDLSHWDVSHVTQFNESFQSARSFNSDLSTWDLTGVDNFGNSFNGAIKFEGHGLSEWDITNATRFAGTFNNTAIATATYDSILISWSNQNANRGVSFNIGNTQACSTEGEVAREKLIRDFNWSISDGGTCDEASNILSFQFPEIQIGDEFIDYTNHIVELEVFPGIDISSVVPVFKLSEGATSTPDGEVSQDFTNSVTYTVTAEDGITTQDWTVNVSFTDQLPFISSWSATAGESITIGLNNQLSYDFNYLWKDENGNLIVFGNHSSSDGNFTSTLPETGIYTLEIFDDFPHLTENYPKDQLLDVLQWGDIEWKSFVKSFKNWPGSDFSATDVPDLSQVTEMFELFYQAENFNGNIGSWDVSNVTNMLELFSGASSFNQDLNNWNVSQVTNFESTFRNATAFNGNVSNWQVNEGANMSFMFSGAENFDQDVSGWQTGKAQDMRDMFASAKAFNQDISQWSVGAVTNMTNMLSGSGLSPQNYDKLLIAWSAQEVLDNVSLGVNDITFCKGEVARQSLIDDHGWIIEDDGQFCLDETDILDFKILGFNKTGVIDAANHTLEIVLPQNTDVSILQPVMTLSPGATSSPANEEVVDFTNPVSITVTAEDGTTTQEWVVTVHVVPSNDFCSGAITITIGETVTGNTTFATNDSNVASSCGSNEVRNDEDGENGGISVGVWYRLIGNGETVILSTCDFADFDTGISVYTGSCSAGLNCLSGNDDGEECEDFRSKLKFNSVVDEEYLILVDGYGSASGEFDLTITSQPTIPPPDNDNCSDAEELTVFAEGAGTPTNGTNSHATTFTKPQLCDQYGTINDVWYRFNSGANVEVSVTVALTDTDLDGPLEVAEFIRIDGYETCGGESLDLCENQGTFSMEVQPNTDYLLQLWNDEVSEGTFTILVNDGPNTAAIVEDAEVAISRFSTSGSLVVTVESNDEEGHEQRYSIEAGNEESIFAINEVTGEISVINEAALLASATTSFELTIQAADQGPGTLTSTGTVTINIIDNDFPEIANQSASVDENASNGTVVMQVIASDDDGIEFSIAEGQGDVPFVISSAGEITVSDETALNFEEQSVFEFVVKVQDDDALLPLASTAAITITLNDVNEAPVLTSLPDFGISGFLPNGSLIRTISFQDQDAGQTHSFAITAGNDDGIFGINTGTGRITVVNSDALEALENGSAITLTVTVTDDGVPPLTGQTEVLMSVFKNAAPVIVTTSFTIDENLANGTEVGTVLATDAEGDAISFSLIGGNSLGAFSIDEDGVITVADEEVLNFEVNPSFELIIEASDDSEGSLATTEAITITLQDVNEAPTADGLSLNMSAFVQNGHVWGTVVASDPENDVLSYSIVSGNDDGVFAIDANTGVGTVLDASQINVENTPSYDLEIAVSDGELSAIISAEIFVFVNRFPALIASDFDIDENSSAGTVIATLSSDDADGIESYEIMSASEEGILSLNSKTGVITLVGSGSAFELDYEALQEIVLEVKLTDLGIGQLEATETVTISVNDINEFTPVIDEVQVNALNENVASGTVVASVIASDEDIFQSLSYTITGGNTGDAFTISNSGIITVNSSAALDFEVNPSFVLTVEVSDDVETIRTVTQQVNIALTDVNEAPVLTAFEAQIGKVGEELSITAVASDVDLPANTLVYSIDTDSQNKGITIDPASGVLVWTPTVDQIGDHTVVVSVSDGEFSDEESVSITIHSIATEILTFVLDAQTGDATIDSVSHEILLEVQRGTDLTTLAPVFTISAGATSNPISGSTIDFSESAIITVTAQDGETTQAWTVSVTEALNSANDILTFEVAEQVEPATIDIENHTISLVVNDSADITALVPVLTLSEDATSDPVSGTDQDFSDNVTYTVTAANGDAQEWTVSVDQEVVLSSEKDILTFEVAEQVSIPIIDATNHTVEVLVAEGTDLTSLAPVFAVSEGATSDPGSGEVVDFTISEDSSVVYTLTAEDGTTQAWRVLVEVEVLTVPKTSTTILSFTLSEQVSDAEIDTDNHTVTVVVAFGTNVTALTPTFTLSDGATSDPASGEAIDFTSPVVITVTAEDEVTVQEWTVTVEVEEEDSEPDPDLLSADKGMDLKIYPNPVASQLYINAKTTVSARLVDIEGKTLRDSKTGTDISFDVADLSAGMYLLIIESGNDITTHRILKDH